MLPLYNANFKMVRTHPAQKCLQVENTKRRTNNILVQNKGQWIKGYTMLNRQVFSVFLKASTEGALLTYVGRQLDMTAYKNYGR